MTKARRGPPTPFQDPTGDKGWIAPFARAQAEDWTEIAISPPGWNDVPSLRLVVLSDLHTGAHTDDIARLQRIVARAAAWGADLAVFVGDFVNMQPFGGGRVPPETTAEILAELAPPLGRFAVLGNHDWDYGPDTVRRALQTTGVRVLENERDEVQFSERSLQIVGLSDEKRGSPAVAAVFARIDPGPALVMAHDPASFAEVPHGPYLTVSGHTHGGQVCLPGIGPMVNSSRAPLRWTSGHVVEGGRHLLVGRGLGTSGLPMRWNCRPEVLLVTLTPGLAD